MRCEDFAHDIAGLADDSLDPARQRAVDAHVSGCDACRALLADLGEIRLAAGALERREPPPGFRERLHSRLAQDPLPARAGRWPGRPARPAAWMGVAAALLLAIGAGLYPLLSRSAPTVSSSVAVPGETGPEETTLVASVESDLQTAEAHYQRAIDGLERIAASDGEALDPQMADVLQKNLQVIDLAIGESRAALRTEPTSQFAQTSLFEAMRSKVSLLQQTVELINEMRKGNQAEAGRLIQGLNQP